MVMHLYLPFHDFAHDTYLRKDFATDNSLLLLQPSMLHKMPKCVCKCGIFYAGIMTIQTYAHFACTCISREKKCLIMHLEHSHLPRGNMHVDKTLLHPLLHLSLPILLVFIRLLWHGCITWQCEIETIRGKQLIQCKKKGVNYLFGSIRDG